MSDENYSRVYGRELTRFESTGLGPVSSNADSLGDDSDSGGRLSCAISDVGGGTTSTLDANLSS